MNCEPKNFLFRHLKLDKIVSPNVVGGTLILGLIALSVVMCYAFYPSKEECLEEIRFIRADALSGATAAAAAAVTRNAAYGLSSIIAVAAVSGAEEDRKSTRLNSSH